MRACVLSPILSWLESDNAIFEVKKRGNTHTLQTSALLCPFQRDYSSLAYTLSHPLNTVIYADTAVLVIGSICYEKSFELLSGISEDWRHTEMLCFKRACVWACLFFSRSMLTSYSCSDGKEMYKKTWCTCKVVVFLIKTYCFFVILVAVAVVGSACLSWLGWRGDLLCRENFSP